jgi:hypothetical protein
MDIRGKLRRMRHTLSLLAIAAGPAMVEAQTRDSSVAEAPARIQDNSFLVEEAYNQEAGVVQHITTFQSQRGSSDFDAAFTQEWPVGSIRHQLSYDIPLVRAGSVTGFGDIGINYRFQMVGDGDARVAVAPRLSLILPTGDWKASRGNGSAGIEGNIPVSYVISQFLVTHVNARASLTPGARDAAGHKAGISEWSVAQSVIITTSGIIQPMLEAVYSRGREVVDEERTGTTESLVISPGLRAAINFASGLQVVPGIAVPLGVGPSRHERSVFLYLSFEHAFSR